MFDYKHYVPILRWKAAEKEALEKLSDEYKNYLTPLIELIMPQSPYKIKVNGVERIKTIEELHTESLEIFKSKVPEISKEILKYWGISPIFMDLSLIDFSLRLDGLNKIMKSADELGVSIIPVIGLATDAAYINAVIPYAKKQGIALRLFRPDIMESNHDVVTAFLDTYGLSPTNINLIVDFQKTDGQCQKLNEVIGKIPSIGDWKSFTFVNGIFPKDLTDLTIDIHFIDRLDWNCWEKQIGENLQRKPAFGDYTIQHPIYIEPTRGANPSASIRYTLPTQWLIMRGQGLRNEDSAGFAQYPAQARLLMEHSQFFGEDFSYGDAYIASIGKDVANKKTGNPRTWLRAGINHHLACVASQISSLP